MALCLTNPGRKMQLILRDDAKSRRAKGPRAADIIVIDILGKDVGKQGVSLGEDMEGLYHLQRTQVRKQWAYQEGSTLTDYPRTEERLPILNLIVRGRTVAEFEKIETMLWRVLSLRWSCYLRVYSELSGWRELRVRLLEAPSDKTKYDFGLRLHATHTVKLLAVDPFWYSLEETQRLKRSDMVLTGGSYLGYVNAWNPADNDCWPQWASNEITVTETWTLPDMFGVYTAKTAPTPDKIGQQVTHTLPSLGPGKEFVVTTYPDMPTLLVRDGGQDWARMRAEAFDFPIDEGRYTPAPLPVRLVGGTADSEITLYMHRRWERFMGGEAA